MRSKRSYITVLVLSLLMSAADCLGQSEEVFVYDALKDKTEPAFLAHTAVEAINSKAHKGTMEKTQAFREASDSLGFYYKAFNWVDIGFNTLRFGMNVKNTYDVAKKRINGIISLLELYEKECLAHGNIEREDQEILDIGKELYSSVESDVNDISTTAVAIAGYVTLKFPCTTFSMLNDLKSLNNSLEHIQYTLNNAYKRLYLFMVTRTGLRWNMTYTPIDRISVAEGAIGRWRAATQQSLNRMAGATE